MTSCIINRRFLSLFTLFVFVAVTGTAQKKKANELKFGEIKVADFDPSVHSFDSTADAVVLYDKGNSFFRGTNNGWFALVYERHQRIKVISKNGKDAGDFIISQYKSNNTEEKIDKLKASTFNLENGVVVETKLNSKDIFTDRLNKKYSLTKFGMPNVKEGSIIDVTYTIVSDFLFNLQPWTFQRQYPVVHSEYTTSIPEFFAYVTLTQGYIPFTDKQVKSFVNNYTVISSGNFAGSRPERTDLTTNETEITWIMKNVPALKSEPFTTTLDNHVSKISFQLSEYRFPNQAPQPVMSTWLKVGETLMKDEEFGASLNKNNNWLDDDVKKITAGASTDLEKAKALYNHMREKFSISTRGGIYMSDNPRTIWKNMKGNVTDANLMLVMLFHVAGLKCDPVLLSTRSNGVTNDMYPLMDQYNYVICRSNIDGKIYHLDATEPLLAFGNLPLICYNGHARIISEMPAPIYLFADSVKESKTTMITLFGSEEKPWEGLVNSRPGIYESLGIREKVKDKGVEAIEGDIKNALPAESEVKKLEIDAKNECDKPLAVSYLVDLESLKDEDIIYLNPLLGERTKENPFSAAERQYPVEMPYTFKETILTNIKVPAGYMVDELPKQARVKLENDEGIFEYLIQHEDESIQLRCVLEIKRANFEAEQYEMLRNFFTYVVNKQNEQIVFKKKS
jgi:hypothetical protein